MKPAKPQQTMYLIDYWSPQFGDVRCRYLRLFRTKAAAQSAAKKHARTTPGYDIAAEKAHPASNGGASEYACCKAGIMIHTVRVED